MGKILNLKVSHLILGFSLVLYFASAVLQVIGFSHAVKHIFPGSSVLQFVATMAVMLGVLGIYFALLPSFWETVKGFLGLCDKKWYRISPNHYKRTYNPWTYETEQA